MEPCCQDGIQVEPRQFLRLRGGGRSLTKVLHKAEWVLLAAGLLLLGFYIAARIHGSVVQRAELLNFKEEIRNPSGVELIHPLGTQTKPDFSLWSRKRIDDYQHALTQYAESPLAVLRISKVRLEVPVVRSTDELSLNVGVGHISGTVLPGEEGNIGIAGHRDGFFRVLKDVAPGDQIELQSPHRTDTYVIDRIVIVSTDDVSVLQPRLRPSVTLVTCYPFYFIGSAPKRYIVQASLTSSEPLNARASAEANSRITTIKEAVNIR
jgi:sortase A